MELLNTSRFYQRAYFQNKLGTSVVLACKPTGRDETSKIAPKQKRWARVLWNDMAAKSGGRKLGCLSTGARILWSTGTDANRQKGAAPESKHDARARRQPPWASAAALGEREGERERKRREKQRWERKVREGGEERGLAPPPRPVMRT